MNSNPIIAEVRKQREEICARYGNDLTRYSQHLTELEAELRKAGRFRFVDYSASEQPVVREEPAPYRSGKTKG